VSLAPFWANLALYQTGSKLEFTHLGREGSVGYARHQSTKRSNDAYTLPTAMVQLLAPFALLFSERVWRHAQVLLVGTILTPGKRTVGAALRIMGLGRIEQYQRYHRVLNRAVWSSREASRMLLGLLVKTFLPEGRPLVIGLDDTLERRWGAKIAAKGIYRDPLRSSHSHFAKVSGLRWVCLMLLVPVPWAARVWALPFLSVLAPSERYAQERGKPHKKLTDWARQMLLLVSSWWPEREIVAVADSSYACIRLLAACQRFLPKPVTFVVTRLRLDAALYEPAPLRKPKQTGRPHLKGKRLPTLAVVANTPGTIWTSVAVANWYGKGKRTVEVARPWRSGTTLGYRRCPALGCGPRSARRVRPTSPTVHRSHCRTCANLELVRLALADRGDFPRSAATPWGRDAASVVGASHPADDARAFGSVLDRHALRQSANGAAGLRGAPAGGVVSQSPPDLLRCTGLSTAGVVGGGDFLRVGSKSGHGKSAA